MNKVTSQQQMAGDQDERQKIKRVQVLEINERLLREPTQPFTSLMTVDWFKSFHRRMCNGIVKESTRHQFFLIHRKDSRPLRRLIKRLNFRFRTRKGYVILVLRLAR